MIKEELARRFHEFLYQRQRHYVESIYESIKKGQEIHKIELGECSGVYARMIEDWLRSEGFMVNSSLTSTPPTRTYQVYVVLDPFYKALAVTE